MNPLEAQILETLGRLDTHRQANALAYLRYLEGVALPTGKSGREINTFLERYGQPFNDVEKMQAAIEEAFESVHLDEWDLSA